MLRIANAPCSWGILEFEFDTGGEPAGYAQVLDEMMAAGYDGTELGDWGFMPVDPKELRAELKMRSLELAGAFVPVAFSLGSAHGRGPDLALKTARLMADAGFDGALLILADDNGSDPVRTKNAGRITPEMKLKPAQWELFAHGVNRVASRVKEETGLLTAFHHHCGGFVETTEEIDILLSMTDPSLIGLVLDTGHLSFGGGDPVQFIQEYSDRIQHIHFKDCSKEIARRARVREWDYFESVEAGVFCELGKGSVDSQGITAELIRQKYAGWIVVEQDVLPGMGAPLACARRNRTYLRSLLGANSETGSLTPSAGTLSSGTLQWPRKG